MKRAKEAERTANVRFYVKRTAAVRIYAKRIAELFSYIKERENYERKRQPYPENPG